MIKVVLTGSECTGKTELARRLGEHYGAPVSVEFVRDYAAGREGMLQFNDHGPIARGQRAAEDAAIARAKDLVFLDTDLVSTAVYCAHYFGRAPEWIDEEAKSRAADLYLLTDIDIPWVADGIRDRGERREEMQTLFRRKLQQMGATFVEIRGSREERFARAKAAVDAMRTVKSGA